MRQPNLIGESRQFLECLGSAIEDDQLFPRNEIATNDPLPTDGMGFRRRHRKFGNVIAIAANDPAISIFHARSFWRVMAWLVQEGVCFHAPISETKRGNKTVRLKVKYGHGSPYCFRRFHIFNVDKFSAVLKRSGILPTEVHKTAYVETWQARVRQERDQKDSDFFDL